VCSVDEEPGDDEVLQVLSEARRLAVDAELRDDCAQQSLVTSSLHRLCDIRHQVELPSHSVSLTPAIIVRHQVELPSHSICH